MGSSGNYGMGTRDMARAGRVALDRACTSKEISLSSRSTLGERWGHAAEFIKHDQGVNRLEKVTADHAKAYGERLAALAREGQLSASTAQNRLSALNTVMKILTSGKWSSVSPRACGIPARQTVAKVDKASTGAADRSSSGKVVADLCRSLGLRFKEASLLDTRRALSEATRSGVVRIDVGTKGGRARNVPASPEAIKALQAAAAAQAAGGGRCVVPKGTTYAQFSRDMYKYGGSRFHSERHAYAQQRYHQLTGARAPVAMGLSRRQHVATCAAARGVSYREFREIDRAARMTISAELGHGREDVTSAYLG